MKQGYRDKGTTGQRDKGTEGQRDKGTKGQKDKRTNGQTDKRTKGTKGQRDKGTNGQNFKLTHNLLVQTYTQPFVTKKTHATSQDQKKSLQRLGTKKSCHLLV